MNPFGVSVPTKVDLLAIYPWSAAIKNAREDYHRGYVINELCDTCTDVATCGRCKYKARLLLKVATNEDECAQLLEIIDRPSPFAAKCGTNGGYHVHRKAKSKPCRPCMDAFNEGQRRRWAEKKATS